MTLLFKNRPFVAICIAVLVSFIGIGMVVPVRVLYAQSQGASLAIIGAMGSAFLLTSFIFQYPTGWAADMIGRKPMMVFTLAAQTVLSIAYIFVTDPIVFVVLRCLEGMVWAGFLPAARAYVTDAIPDEQRGQAFGIFGAALSAGFMLGPGIGGLVASAGYAVAFLGSSVFRFLALILVLLIVPGGGRVHAEARARARAVPTRALFTLPLVAVYILFIGDNFFFGFDLTLMPIWMRNILGAPVAMIGMAYVAWSLPNLLGSPIGGRLADRMRRPIVILIFGLAQVPLWLSYGLVTALLPIMILIAIHGAVVALMQPSVDASLATASPPDARARAQGMYSALGLASGFVAALVLPPLYGINYRLPFIAMTAGFAVCILTGGTLLRLAESRSPTGSVRQIAAE